MRKIVWIIMLCLIVSGCATTTKALKRISLGMTKEDIVKKMGEPTAVRGAIKNKYNQTIEVWEYELLPPGYVLRAAGAGMAGSAVSGAEEKNYWLYFYDNKLVQWGQPGDWKREADGIYEINFDTGQRLRR